MTIDMHTHLFVREFRNESFVAPLWDAGQHTARKPDEVAKETQRDWDPFDPDGTEHIRRMDEAGIEKALLLHIDNGLLFGEAEMSIEQQNK